MLREISVVACTVLVLELVAPSSCDKIVVSACTTEEGGRCVFRCAQVEGRRVFWMSKVTLSHVPGVQQYIPDTCKHWYQYVSKYTK